MPSMKIILLLSAVVMMVYFVDNSAASPYPTIGTGNSKKKRLGNCAFVFIIFFSSVYVMKLGRLFERENAQRQLGDEKAFKKTFEYLWFNFMFCCGNWVWIINICRHCCANVHWKISGHTTNKHLPLIDLFGGYDILGVCLRNCAQCKKMFGNFFEGQLCADSCVKFKGKVIPDCEDLGNKTIKSKLA